MILTFRKKIVLSHILVFLIFSAFLYPIVTMTVKQLMRRSMFGITEKMISDLQKEPNQSAMLSFMKNNFEFTYRAYTLMDGQGNIIFHNYLPTTDEAEVQRVELGEPEVIEAIQYGVGFKEKVSPFFHVKFYFVAMAFEAHGQKYILHVNFFASVVDRLIFNFEIAIFLICLVVIGITTLLDSTLSNLILRPMQRIINALQPYEFGREELLPKIALSKEDQKGEFGKLASVLNSLRSRIENQIDNLTSQRKETEEILESLGEGVIAVDQKGRVTFVNNTACKLFEVDRKDILHKKFDHLTSELAKESHENIQHVLEHAEPIIQTLTIRDTSPLFLDLIAAPLPNKTGAILVIQDKTTSYRILEVGKDFIANASHELRTPITIIRGFAETLQDIPDLSKEMLFEITEKIVRTCIRLDKLVRSLITLSDTEHLPQERLQASDFITIVQKCMEQLLTLNPNAHVSLKTEMKTAPIFVDIDLIEMAVTNILENAVKYSPKEAEIEILIDRLGDEIQLKIKDKGIGIAEADLPHIFDRFYTVDKARSRKSGGAGLGLSIVKNVIEKHKGKIFATSEIGKGSTFTILLPAIKK